MALASMLLSRLWGAAAERKRAWWDAHGARCARGDVPVMSVGGLEIGGSGKTPVVEYVLRDLVAAGRRPGLCTRGYGRRARGLRLRLRGMPAQVDAIGDEASMLVGAGLDVPIAAVAHRIDGVRALAALGCDCVVLDDAFVHRQLARDLDIVVLRADAPIGNGHFVPRGRLREDPRALGRAHVVWFHDKGHGHHRAAQQALCAAHAPGALLVHSRAELVDAQDAFGARHRLAGAPIIAAAGIAHPLTFARLLTQAGADVRAMHDRADHAPFDRALARRLVAQARALQAAAVVVTAKDWPKWAPRWPAALGVPLWQARQQLRAEGPGLAGAQALWRNASLA